MSIFSKIFGPAAISPQEAREKMKAAGKYILLDVRTPQEFKEVKISGAKNIPVDQLEQRAPAELPDKNAPIFIYCKSGMRAGSAAGILQRMGYKNAVSFGGIMGWPYETVRG